MPSISDDRESVPIPQPTINGDDLSDDVLWYIFEILGKSRRSRVEAAYGTAVDCHSEFYEVDRPPLAVACVSPIWRRVATMNPGKWSQIRVVVAQTQLSADPRVLWVNNQAEIVLLAALSKPHPIALSFVMATKPPPFPATKFQIGGFLNRVESILVDVAIARLVTTLSVIVMENLKRIHVRQGCINEEGDMLTQSMLDVQYFIASQFWRSQVGVEAVVWSARNYRTLECPIQWDRLTILWVAGVTFHVSEWDVSTLLMDCVHLTTLTVPLIQYTTSSGRPNRSETVIGPLPDRIVSSSLETLRFLHQCHRPWGAPVDEKNMLPGLHTPMLTKVVVDHSSCPTLEEVFYLSNPLTVSGLHSLHLNAGSALPKNLDAILLAMPVLKNLTLAAQSSKWDSHFRNVRGLGIDVEVLESVARSCVALESFKACGESWLTISAVNALIAGCPSLRAVSIEVWGGISAANFHVWRDSLPRVHVRCAMTGLCRSGSEARPRMMFSTAWANRDPSYDYCTIFDPKDHLIAATESSMRVCEFCEEEHRGDLIDSDGWAKLLCKDPDEFV